MKLLLDTHTFLWFIGGSAELSDDAKALTEDSENEVFLSIASLWEMAIKISLNKLRLANSFDTFIPEQLALNQITLLNISVAHTADVTTLPFHHCDPFDRLLIAQAKVENMALISRDEAFDSYPIKRLW